MATSSEFELQRLHKIFEVTVIAEFNPLVEGEPFVSLEQVEDAGIFVNECLLTVHDESIADELRKGGKFTLILKKQ